MADEAPDRPDKNPERANPSGIGWGFGILAAIVVLILLSYGLGNNARWGENNRIAHMMPPASSSSDGPATRAWKPNTP
jgi:hypothetical protein